MEFSNKTGLRCFNAWAPVTFARQYLYTTATQPVSEIEGARVIPENTFCSCYNNDFVYHKSK